MDKIIAIDKPKDYTSRDIVNIVSKKLNTKKAGHTGTLDPLATGILVICTNKYLKLVENLMNHDKEYIAEVIFGIETDTLDITGNILNKKEKQISKEELIKVLDSFKGKSIQEVPKYSAVKVNGKKLYEYARNGIEVELPKKEIEVYDIELLDFNDNKFTFKCHVSKGTYIRSLIRDIGYKLNTYACMTNLRRTKLGKVTLNDINTLEDIENNNIKELNPVDILELDKEVISDDKIINKIKNGCKLNKSIKVGILITPYCLAKSLCLSTSILIISISISSLKSSKTGDNILQGPHQVA